jgi:uncharacterized Zn-binding protein involved in type VI secretion
MASLNGHPRTSENDREHKRFSVRLLGVVLQPAIKRPGRVIGPSYRLELLTALQGRFMISSARLGDKHVCPMPGHGTTAIVSASTDVSINFMGSARVGDVCGCGAAITTGFPSIQMNGRPMAHLGSLTSHGGTITTGSNDVGGGFVMGDAAGATVLDFMALGAIRPDGTVDDEKMAALLADPKLVEKAIAVNALVGRKVAPATCNDPDRMEELASYIAGEMNTNMTHPSVLEMKELLSFDPEAEHRKYKEGVPPLSSHGGWAGLQQFGTWKEGQGVCYLDGARRAEPSMGSQIQIAETIWWESSPQTRRI